MTTSNSDNEIQSNRFGVNPNNIFTEPKKKSKVPGRIIGGTVATFLVAGTLTTLVGLLYHFGILQVILQKAGIAHLGSANPLLWKGLVYGGGGITALLGTGTLGTYLYRKRIFRKVARLVKKKLNQVNWPTISLDRFYFKESSFSSEEDLSKKQKKVLTSDVRNKDDEADARRKGYL